MPEKKESSTSELVIKRTLEERRGGEVNTDTVEEILLPSFHSGNDKKIILMSSKPALNFVKEKAKLHTNHQRCHR